MLSASSARLPRVEADEIGWSMLGGMVTQLRKGITGQRYGFPAFSVADTLRPVSHSVT